MVINVELVTFVGLEVWVAKDDALDDELLVKLAELEEVDERAEEVVEEDDEADAD